jgi:ferredoxin
MLRSMSHIQNLDKPKIIMENGKAHVNPETCGNCGKCIQKCPFDAIETGDNVEIG